MKIKHNFLFLNLTCYVLDRYSRYMSCKPTSYMTKIMFYDYYVQYGYCYPLCVHTLLDIHVVHTFILIHHVHTRTTPERGTATAFVPSCTRSTAATSPTRYESVASPPVWPTPRHRHRPPGGQTPIETRFERRANTFLTRFDPVPQTHTNVHGIFEHILRPP